jgi:AsmA protein
MPSPWIWRAIWAVGLALIVGTLAFAALPYIASTRIVRDRIAWEMSAWSGFRVAIDGTPQIEVWPKFRAILTDVTLSKWTETNAPPVVQAERVEIDLSALAALRGDVVFQAAHLIRPTLRVERLANGLFSPPVPTGGRIARSVDTAHGVVEADPAKPNLDQLPSDPFGTVEVRDGRIVGAVNGKDAEILTGLNGQVTWSALNTGATLSATGIWRGESVSVDLSSASPLLLFAGGTSAVSASFKSAPANFSFDGNASLAQNAFFDGQAKFTAPSLRRVLEWLGANPASGGTIGTVSVTSKVTGETGRIKFSGTELTLNKNPGMGALELSFADALPVVSGTLAFDTLDLRSFLSAFTPIGSSSGHVPDEIDTSFADRFNLDLRLSAAHATAGSIQLSDVAATAQVKNGLAVFDVSDAAAFGGNIQSSLRFDRKPEGTQVEMRLLASDVDGAQFGAAAGMKRLVPTGTGSVSIILKGPGKTWDSIFDNSDGSVSANFGQGTLTGLNLPAFLKRCQEGGFFPLNDVTDGALPIDGAELKASISNGVARIDKAEARSAKTRVWVSGIVPYAGGGLALSGGIAPTGAAPADAQQTASTPQDSGNQVSFFVGGTWATPFISPISQPRAGN